MDNAAALIGVHLKIIGRVQGVYFRASTLEKAASLGLTGWVRNCDDGSVEVVAEGSRAKLEELIAWCRLGPAGARVSQVEVRWQSAENSLRGFSIKR
jgi:acylphosphatase